MVGSSFHCLLQMILDGFWASQLISAIPGASAPSAPSTTPRLSAGLAGKLRRENARREGARTADLGQLQNRQRAHGRSSVYLERHGTGVGSRTRELETKCVRTDSYICAQFICLTTQSAEKVRSVQGMFLSTAKVHVLFRSPTSSTLLQSFSFTTASRGGPRNAK